ncbi:unnamed protein product [Phyllotreta striolata]|uniref:BAT2 N-terminal domain-containing protein n=1 Tax=Phyllotreta striolata TaxID=444603 RepID=A0A9P0DZX4_PHYSR|nr:unnamed protein product [Phyllotreta striolata]
MSTLPGQASKGEKTKPKFQSLDINSLYRVSRGENLEKQQQKSSSVYIKHGMQSLGKVPNARRAPANLPSLKSEHSGTDTAVPLVPPGAQGWGKQDGASNAGSPSPSGNTNSAQPEDLNSAPLSAPNQAGPQPQLNSHQASAALPPSNAIAPHPHKPMTSSAQPAPTDKLWSSVMSGQESHPPLYQSVQFQHEFPSLSSGDGGPIRTGSDAPQYPSGLSLRPQTEGSWTQGGQRSLGPPGTGGEGAVQGKPGAAHLGAPPQLPVQVGIQQQQQQQQQQPFPPQIRGVMPSFMYKGSNFQQGPGIGVQNSQNMAAPVNGRSHRPIDNRPPRLADRDIEDMPRPIIKEEELSRMDEISKDMGWAESDEIDYNQKLAFSDDEGEKTQKKETKRSQIGRDQRDVRDGHNVDNQNRQWGSRSNAPRGRCSEDEDIWSQRRSQQDKEVEIAVQRAKQRKEEEEKRFNEERKQAAAKKLMELEEKIHKRDKDNVEGSGTINPCSIPPKPINHVDIPLPDFQKDKDKDVRSHTPNESDDKNQPPNQGGNTFRQLTQIEGKNFASRKQKSSERDGREMSGPNFSRQFQNDLPPRFLKHHQRNNSNISNPQQFHRDSFDNRWNSNNKSQSNSFHPLHKNLKQDGLETEKDEFDRKDYKRQSSEESYHTHSQEMSQKSQDSRYHADEIRHHDYERREDYDKRQRDKAPQDVKQGDQTYHFGNEDWDDRRTEKSTEKYEKERDCSQRPDSRDSHMSKHSRDLDYNMSSWSEVMYDTNIEEKKKDREERRIVPGPITKDRIEADDIRSEKRNLTQLKRGQAVDIKSESKKDNEKKDFSSAWADSIPSSMDENRSKIDDKSSSDHSKKSDDYQSRNKSFDQKKGWGGSESHVPRNRPVSWPKRPSSRGQKSGNREYPTDSDGSLDDHKQDKGDSNEPNSPKSSRKSLKDDKNRDGKQDNYNDKRKEKPDRKDNNYVPRGEPSRHGRGGNFRNTRMGGLGKRIDGYGPPPTKSPFGGHHDDKERDKKPSDGSGNAPGEDKTKQNQQALAAGIIGKRSEPCSNMDDKNKDKSRNKSDSRRNKLKPDDKGSDGLGDKKLQPKPQNNRSSSNSNRSRNNTPRLAGGDKKFDGNRGDNVRQNSSGSLKREDKSSENSADAKSHDDNDSGEGKEEKGSLNGDSEGFQEVKSKKNVKERQKSLEDKSSKGNKSDFGKGESKNDRDRKKISQATQQLTQQQIQNIPSLMATPVNPPPVLPQSKSQFDRPRQTKLPPRFAKQKLQKQQQQQQQQQNHPIGDVDMNVYVMKDNGIPATMSTCAWDKPLGPQLRKVEHDSMLGPSMEAVKALESAHSPSQGVTSPGNEKMIGKTSPLQDKSLLDGSTPPVNTIIFENTNFKSAPGPRNAGRPDSKPRSKLDDGSTDNSVISSFNKPNMNDLLQAKSDKADSMPLQLFKEDSADMKLDFFTADLQFADDKSSKNFAPKPIHAMTGGNNTVDSLDYKIASVKKVWETSEQENDENQIGFAGPTLDSNVFAQGKDAPDDNINHEVYSPSPSQSVSTTTNVCKVKPTQQVSGSGQTALSSTHQTHAGMVAPGLMGNPLSPPPIQPVLGPNVGMNPQYTANQHIGYQANLSGSTQYGISAIPSPPTVPLVYNSTQQIQAAAQSAGLYGAFQIDQLGGQGRSQYSQYPNYHGLGQTANSPYSAQSVFLPTAAPPPPHPPPSAPELYSSISNYRMSAAGPFGQNQQLNNPTTVLISSTSNSLMSASVKPSSQPISAIGTKAGGVGQAYQQQSQQGQQVFMAYDPTIQANYLASSAGVMQRAPVAQAQNNVVPGLQPSSSFYSGSTGGQTGFYQQQASSSIGSQMQQHQGGYGMQGNVFGTHSHSQSHANTGMQNFNSHFLTTPIVAAALNAQAQQFRSGLPASYMKGVGMGDQSGRPQQLKSPGSQEVLSSVFNTVFFAGPQIPSPKSRQNSKHPPPQSSPTAQQKYNLYQGVGGSNMQRYPTPIQRPVNFQVQQNSANQKHRNTSNKTPNRQYYGNQSQNEKSEEGKMNDNTNTAGTVKTVLGTSSGCSVTAPAEKIKDSIKEEPAMLKD